MEGAYTYVNGKFTQIQPMRDLFDNIIYQFEQERETNNKLREANAALKSEQYAKDEVARMEKRYKEMQDDYYRGFPITKEETEQIKDWQNRHIEHHHGGYHTKSAIGGQFYYEFHPTSIGISARCICSSCKTKVQHIYSQHMSKRINEDYDLLRQLKTEYDCEFEFQSL